MHRNIPEIKIKPVTKFVNTYNVYKNHTFIALLTASLLRSSLRQTLTITLTSAAKSETAKCSATHIYHWYIVFILIAVTYGTR